MLVSLPAFHATCPLLRHAAWHLMDTHRTCQRPSQAEAVDVVVFTGAKMHSGLSQQADASFLRPRPGALLALGRGERSW